MKCHFNLPYILFQRQMKQKRLSGIQMFWAGTLAEPILAEMCRSIDKGVYVKNIMNIFIRLTFTFGTALQSGMQLTLILHWNFTCQDISSKSDQNSFKKKKSFNPLQLCLQFLTLPHETGPMSTVSENHIIIYMQAIPRFNCYLDYPDSLSLSLLSRISFLTTGAMMLSIFMSYAIIGHNDSGDEILKIMKMSHPTEQQLQQLQQQTDESQVL